MKCNACALQHHLKTLSTFLVGTEGKESSFYISQQRVFELLLHNLLTKILKKPPCIQQCWALGVPGWQQAPVRGGAMCVGCARRCAPRFWAVSFLPAGHVGPSHFYRTETFSASRKNRPHRSDCHNIKARSAPVLEWAPSEGNQPVGPFLVKSVTKRGILILSLYLRTLLNC